MKCMTDAFKKLHATIILLVDNAKNTRQNINMNTTCVILQESGTLPDVTIFRVTTILDSWSQQTR